MLALLRGEDLLDDDLLQDDLRLAVTAPSNPAAIASNSGLGPFQRNCSTSPKRGMSVRNVASLRNSSASSHSWRSVSASAPALVAFTCHSRQSSGIASRCRNLASTAAVDFAPHP